MKVAFLGLGRMGVAMAGHLLDAGHELTVWNRSGDKAGPLVERGATQAASPAEAAGGAEVVVLMLTDGDAVRAVLLGEAGVAAGAAPGTLVVDASTIGPDAARSVGADVVARGLRYLDAPVTGSTGPAQQGALGVLVGGSQADYDEARPLLTLWGDEEKTRLLGPVGAGSAMKLVANLGVGLAVQGVAEALRLGHDLGLDRDDVLTTLAAGPLAAMVGMKRDMLTSGDYSAVTFSLELLLKDLRLALDAARGDLPATAATAALAEEAVTAGHGPDDIAALAGYLSQEGSANSY